MGPEPRDGVGLRADPDSAVTLAIGKGDRLGA